MKPKLINKKKREQIGPDGKKKKVLIERSGDWLCPKCKNLNFTFRLKCNRCQLSKQDALKLSGELNQKKGQINIGNDPNLLNQLQLIYKTKLLQNLQNQQKQAQNQINNINQIANNNNNLQLLNNNLNYAMNMGINNSYNNINIYNLSSSQIEQLNQRYPNNLNSNLNNNINNNQIVSQLNQLNKNNQLNIPNLSQLNNLNNQNIVQPQLNNQINRQITYNNLNNQFNNQINQQLLNRYQKLDPSFINKLNQQQSSQIVNNTDDYDNLYKQLELLNLGNNNLNLHLPNLGFNNNNPNVNTVQNTTNNVPNNNNNYLFKNNINNIPNITKTENPLMKSLNPSDTRQMNINKDNNFMMNDFQNINREIDKSEFIGPGNRDAFNNFMYGNRNNTPNKTKSEDDGSESNDGKEFGNDIDDDF
jgi:hypothetical protein